MEITRRHAIHAVIVFVVLLLGGFIFPQFYHFANVGATFLVTAAYMAVYFVFNLAFSTLAAKVNFDVGNFEFALFMLADFIPGAVALFLMATYYGGFWACTPWLIAVILSVICESLHLVGAFIQEK